MTDFQGPRCETCHYYLHDEKLCRRLPPMVVAWKNPRPKNRDDEIILRSQFPVLLPSGWCGEHKPIGKP